MSAPRRRRPASTYRRGSSSNRGPYAPSTGGAGFARSSFENECSRCGKDILNWRDATRTSGGKWIHKGCASGADDE